MNRLPPSRRPHPPLDTRPVHAHPTEKQTRTPDEWLQAVEASLNADEREWLRARIAELPTNRVARLAVMLTPAEGIAELRRERACLPADAIAVDRIRMLLDDEHNP